MIYFKDTDPAAMELFVGWIYRGASALTSVGDNLVPLLQLYVLADMWCLRQLERSLLNTFLDLFEKQDTEAQFETIRSVLKTCYDDIVLLQALRMMLLYATVELMRKPGLDILKAHSILDFDDIFAKFITLWLVFILKGGDYDRSQLDKYLKG